MLKRTQEIVSQLTGTYYDVANVMHFTLKSNPREAIVNMAKDWNANIIITGTDSSDGLQRLFTNGTVEHIIKIRKCRRG